MAHKEKLSKSDILRFTFLPAFIFSVISMVLFRYLLKPVWFIQLFIFGFFFFLYLFFGVIVVIIRHATRNNFIPYLLWGIFGIVVPFILFAIILGLSGGE